MDNFITQSQNYTYTIHSNENKTVEHIIDVAGDELALINVVFDVHTRAQLTYHPIVIGGKCELTITINMVGEYAHANIRGAYTLKNAHDVKITTLQNHVAPHSESDLEISGVLNDKACMQYTGMIQIAENAHHTKADQQNKTILLSEQAHAVSIPGIEVLNNEVECAHGSAISYIDTTQLLYLQSRGINLIDAQQLLLHGFIERVLSGASESVKHTLLERV